MSLTALFRFWTQLDTPVDRRTYLAHGLGLAAVKYAGDAAIVGVATGQVWTPLDYLSSVYSLLTRFPDDASSWLMPALGVWTLPFLWLGVTLTLRRVVDAGLSSCWIAFLFFVPYVNYALMAVLAGIPTAARGIERRPGTERRGSLLSGAFSSIVAGTAFGFLAAFVMIGFPQAYTGALFLVLPFAMGALTAFLFNRKYDAALGETITITLTMFLAVGAILFLLATEGLVCLLMALPLALVAGITGAVVGRFIANLGQRRLPPAWSAVVALPLLMSWQPSTAGRVLHEVRTSVEVAATPDQVWPHVIAFPAIEESPDLLFRLGIAYPRYAVIRGEGVGALRYCVFSTGAFVEPITWWEAGRRLSFDVRDSPAPLRELSLYENVSPPHLDGYLRPRRGEFRLVPLEGGRTRVEGSTWYELEMAPEGYWQVFSDYLIHRIHQRVLHHIKRQAESAARPVSR